MVYPLHPGLPKASGKQPLIRHTDISVVIHMNTHTDTGK